MEQNKTGKYLKYAIGEIVLVMIGILLALQVNNWNTAKKLDARELVLLSELKSNLETNIENLQSDINTQIFGAKHIDSLIYHLVQRLPYNSSISKHIQHGDFAPDVILTSSAFETLKSSGLDMIRSDSLRQQIINLFEVTYPYLMQETKRLEDQVWPAVVVPLKVKHLRIIDGKITPVNYDNMLNDIEFINMWSMRVSMRKRSTKQKKRASQKTLDVINLLNIELKHRIAQ